MVRVIKPDWVKHATEKNTNCPIYSVSVHPDGTRLATGGLDHKVKIWSTVPILNPKAEEDVTDARLLCTMTTHSGSVLAVRWAHHGRFLATGSDDQVVVIWCLDPEAGGKVWGSNIVNVENWKPMTRLVGHTSDIIDVAWSRDDSMLASVGLDNSIWIWDGYTFERIHRITGHEGFVKGVTWDPVGNFLATQSDDRTVRIWNTETWQLEKIVSEPFQDSPSSTFFRRLSWSPDGAFIAASNAMNGPIFVGAVIERESWGSQISFVGHSNTIQVAAFNPRLFFRQGDEKGRATASSTLALGSNDFSISIWRNSLHKPITVLHDVFGRNLMDLCWSNDGLHLYACSEDGTICAVEFDATEFPDLAEYAMTDQVIKEYGYTPKRRRNAPPAAALENSFGPTTAPTSSRVNTIQPRKNKTGDNRRLISRPKETQTMPRGPMGPASGLGGRNAFDAAPVQASPSGTSRADLLRDAPNRADFGAGVNQLEPRGSKRKAISISDTNRDTPVNRPRLLAEPHEIRAAGGSAVAGPSTARGIHLPARRTLASFRATPESGTDEYYIQAENVAGHKGKNKVTFIEDDADIWLDYLPSPVLAMAITDSFCAVACEDGSLVVYTHAGRQILNMRLDSGYFDIQASGRYLLVVTTTCEARVYDVKSSKVKSTTSIAHLVNPDVDSIGLCENGAPVIFTTIGDAFTYDSSLESWVPVCEARLLEHDTTTSRNTAETVQQIEQKCRSLIQPMANGTAEDPDWWLETQQMAIMQMRMRASVLLGSVDEYRHWLSQYATFLARQDFVGRAEELVKDLIGPLYQRPGRTSDWEATVLGLDKRVLAGTLCAMMQRENANMAPIAQKYQTLLRAIKDEEDDL